MLVFPEFQAHAQGNSHTCALYLESWPLCAGNGMSAPLCWPLPCHQTAACVVAQIIVLPGTDCSQQVRSAISNGDLPPHNIVEDAPSVLLPVSTASAQPVEVEVEATAGPTSAIPQATSAAVPLQNVNKGPRTKQQAAERAVEVEAEATAGRTSAIPQATSAAVPLQNVNEGPRTKQQAAERAAAFLGPKKQVLTEISISHAAAKTFGSTQDEKDTTSLRVSDYDRHLCM